MVGFPSCTCFDYLVKCISGWFGRGMSLLISLLLSPSYKQEGASFSTENSLLFVISLFTWIPRVIPFKEEEMCLSSLCANFCSHQLWKQPFSCCSRTNDLPPGTHKRLLLPPWINAWNWVACIFLLPPASDSISALLHRHSNFPIPWVLSLWQVSPFSMGVPLTTIRKPNSCGLILSHPMLPQPPAGAGSVLHSAKLHHHPVCLLRSLRLYHVDLTELLKVPASRGTG